MGAAAAAAGIFTPRIARAASVTLRVSTPDSATHPNHTILMKFSSLVEERTSGAVKVKIFPDGQLGTIANALTGMQTGTIDMAVNGASMSEGIVPELGVLGLPFMFSDEKTAEKVIDGDVGSMLTGKLADNGIEILAWSTWGWRVTETSNRAIREPKDFQGLKIRLPAGPVFADTFSTLGAIPTVVDSTELYLAVSQGTVDAFEVPFLSLVASKWYEVVKHVSLTNHAYNPVWLAMSKLRMSMLAPEHVQVLKDTAKELQTEWRAHVAEKSSESQKFIQDRGIEVIPVDTAPFRELLMPVYGRFKQKVGAELVDRVLQEARA
jgi:tripartite ATP-independent transporter DctP family solute receptor